MSPITGDGTSLPVQPPSGRDAVVACAVDRVDARATPSSKDHFPARILTLLTCTLIAACTALWESHIVHTETAHVASAVVPTVSAPGRGAVARVPRESAESTMAPVQMTAGKSRFMLSGVVAPRRPGGPGIALIAIDGNATRAYRTGESIERGVVLQSVGQRSATLSSTEGASVQLLELPLYPPSEAGSRTTALAVFTGHSSGSTSTLVAPGVLPAAANTSGEAAPADDMHVQQDTALAARVTASRPSAGRRQRLHRIAIGQAPSAGCAAALQPCPRAF
jgi:hypothetical protein